jgi:hypothetical protein
MEMAYRERWQAETTYGSTARPRCRRTPRITYDIGPTHPSPSSVLLRTALAGASP